MCDDAGEHGALKRVQEIKMKEKMKREREDNVEGKRREINK